MKQLATAIAAVTIFISPCFARAPWFVQDGNVICEVRVPTEFNLSVEGNSCDECQFKGHDRTIVEKIVNGKIESLDCNPLFQAFGE
jgi:hypothetical protein